MINIAIASDHAGHEMKDFLKIMPHILILKLFYTFCLIFIE